MQGERKERRRRRIKIGMKEERENAKDFNGEKKDNEKEKNLKKLIVIRRRKKNDNHKKMLLKIWLEKELGAFNSSLL